MTIPPPICKDCKHFRENEFDLLGCNAFPNGIPDAILQGFNDHSKPLPEQDNDIVFEEK